MPAPWKSAKRRMHQAAELGAIHIISGPPGGKADHDLGARNYRELLEIGLAIGVKPAMEYLGFVDDINTIEAAAEIVQKAGHPQGTVIHDPFHIFRGGGSFESLMKVPADRIAICHFNDAPRQPPRPQQHDKDRVYPGDGHLDLRAWCGCSNRSATTAGCRWSCSAKICGPKIPAEVARTGLEKMRAVVESA